MRKIILFFCTICILCITMGCTVQNNDERRINMEFSVIPYEEAPEKLQEIIEENKKNEIKMSWKSEEGLYLIRGYGAQQTGGYSIRADAVEQGTDGLHITTTLIPPQQEEMIQAVSYPCIILFVKDAEQEVIFES